MENKIIIGIGKGRDGTTSLSKNLEKIVELNKSKVKVHHENLLKIFITIFICILTIN